MPTLTDIQAVLFDLDGTLIDVEMHRFIPAYVQKLAGRFADRVEKRRFVDVALTTVRALITTEDGGRSNEARFLGAMQRHLGIEPGLYRQRLEAFCRDELEELSAHVTAAPVAHDILDLCFARGLKVIIATNPVFHRSVVDARLQWGELADYPYHAVTTLENSRYCKPSTKYFADLTEELDLAPGQCLMVGNDTSHDLAAGQIGMPTFLVDTWIMERKGVAHYRPDYRGGHGELLTFLQESVGGG